MRLDREQRREIVAEMRETGMSTRAIASGLGVHQETVVSDLKQVNGNRSSDPRPVDGHRRQELPDPADAGQGAAETDIGHLAESLSGRYRRMLAGTN